jgi:hypothetical protein
MFTICALVAIIQSRRTKITARRKQVPLRKSMSKPWVFRPQKTSCARHGACYIANNLQLRKCLLTQIFAAFAIAMLVLGNFAIGFGVIAGLILYFHISI